MTTLYAGTPLSNNIEEFISELSSTQNIKEKVDGMVSVFGKEGKSPEKAFHCFGLGGHGIAIFHSDILINKE